jgi:hypothetical protein
MQNTSMERMSSYSNGGSGANSDTEAALHNAALQHCSKLEAVPQVCLEVCRNYCSSCPTEMFHHNCETNNSYLGLPNTLQCGYNSLPYMSLITSL